jgi:hypothetical protein
VAGVVGVDAPHRIGLALFATQRADLAPQLHDIAEADAAHAEVDAPAAGEALLRVRALLPELREVVEALEQGGSPLVLRHADLGQLLPREVEQGRDQRSWN